MMAQRCSDIKPDKSLEKLLSDRDPAHEQMLAYGWHLLFGQPAVLAHRSMSRH